MAVYKRRISSSFKKDYKAIKHNTKICQKLEEALTLLEDGKSLPDNFSDHQLSGKLSHLRECHIFPDVLLIYTIEHKELVLYLLRLGSHSELFG